MHTFLVNLAAVSLKWEVWSLLRDIPKQILSPSSLACQLVQEYAELKRHNALKHHFRSILEHCRERQRISKFATDIQASAASSQSTFTFRQDAKLTQGVAEENVLTNHSRYPKPTLWMRAAGVPVPPVFPPVSRAITIASVFSPLPCCLFSPQCMFRVHKARTTTSALRSVRDFKEAIVQAHVSKLIRNFQVQSLAQHTSSGWDYILYTCCWP